MYAVRLALVRPAAAQLFLVGLVAVTIFAQSATLRAQMPTLTAQPSFGSTATGSSAAASGSIVAGKPYEATRILHTRRSLADGTVTTQDLSIQEARDGSGRVLEEVDTDLPATGGRPSQHLVVIVVTDPAARTSLRWTDLSKVGILTHLPAPPPLIGLPQKKPDDDAVLLGHRMIRGLLCTGHSAKTTIPAGTMGNSAPIVSRHEWWFADDLQVRALDISNDPRHGENTNELISIKAGEPDPARFHLPSGYTVHEMGNPSAHASSTDQPLDVAHAPAVSHDEAIAMLAAQDRQRQLAGAAVLVKEAQASTDPALKDDIAYRFARANVGLPEAQQLAELAVRSAEHDCATTSSSVAAASDFAREITLARYWHTLGYVYDRMGDTDQAKSYLESAWRLDPLAHYGSHLARMDELGGETDDAVRIYRASLNAPGGEELKQTIRERLTALAGDAGTTPQPAVETLAGTAQPAGSALFDITYFSSTNSPVVTFVSGAEPLRALIAAITQQEKAEFALPNDGPERVVRRVEVTCGQQPGSTSGCAIRILGAHEARELLRQH